MPNKYTNIERKRRTCEMNKWEINMQIATVLKRRILTTMPDWARNEKDALALASDTRWSSDHHRKGNVPDGAWVYEVTVWDFEAVPFIATADTLALAICQAWLLSRGVKLPD